MISKLIDLSLQNRGLVLLLAVLLLLIGSYSVRQTPIDAIPDLSDVQVIVKTNYSGQSPQVVEDQITFPLTSALLAVPGAHSVRGYSFYGDSYIYVIFDDKTDLYWARSRVLEYLNQVASKLPEGVTPELGPDATGVGWVYMYALSDPSGQHDLAELRSLQDWFLKLELQSLPGVAEVATVGGMVRQYQITLHPDQLLAHGIPLSLVQTAIRQANQERGASVIEMAEAEYMVRISGYLKSLDDLRQIPIITSAEGIPVLLGDIAEINLGPQMRRGIAELNGQGEVVGGVVVMRHGENAKHTIDGVKEKLASLKANLPDGVQITPVYDRSDLIDSAIDNLWQKLAEELMAVTLICALFLLHIRSSVVILISLPLGVLGAFMIMQWQGLNANIMSLGGIAIAIGAMVDGAVVMVENLHKHLASEPDKPHWQLVQQASREVGPSIFFSLLIITVSFVPVFTLEAQEGRMFAPLAYTKTYAMAMAAGLSITLIPVLMGYLVRGKIRKEQDNPLNRLLTHLYLPLVRTVTRFPLLTLLLALMLTISAVWPWQQLGSEFMPELDEGDLMYMPTTYPAISIGKARQLLQQTDAAIRTLPEVESVFGKVGRAETATDPAPLTMIETFIQLKPKSQWRDGVTTAKLKQELDALVQVPGLSNAWVMPIKTRIDMLATGIKTPIGIKILGPDLAEIERLGRDVEQILAPLPEIDSVYAERVAGGRYLDVEINRIQAARYGLNIRELQELIATAVGGMNLTQTVEDRARYPVNLRYPQSLRNSPEQLANLPIITQSGIQLTLADVAELRIQSGAPMIKSDNARPTGWVFVSLSSQDLGGFVATAKPLLAEQLKLPVGYSLEWTGHYQYMERAEERLSYIVPFTLAIIVLLLYLNFGRIQEISIILLTLPLALVGSFWLLWWLNFQLSVAVMVGLIALAGVAVETSVLMLLYLQHSYQDWQAECEQQQRPLTQQGLRQAIHAGAALRLRPKMMTVATIIIGLLPIMHGQGTGSEIMSRIAAPMIGGMSSALVLTLLVIPAIFMLWKRRGLAKQ